MAAQSWIQQIDNTSADGTALANSTTPTSIVSVLRRYTLPANQLDSVGKKFRFTAYGRISTVVTTPGTLTLTLRFGAVNVVTSGALPLNVTAQTNTPWKWEADCEMRTIGNSTTATVFGLGEFTSRALVGSGAAGTSGVGTEVTPYNAAPAVGTGFDSTASQQVDLFATWSVANAANSILCHIFSFELLN